MRFQGRLEEAIDKNLGNKMLLQIHPDHMDRGYTCTAARVPT